MRGIEISPHELRVVAVLLDGQWHDVDETAELAQVNPRTTRYHMVRLADLGVLEKAKVYPRHKFRWRPAKGCRPYLQRLRAASDALGVDLDDQRLTV